MISTSEAVAAKDPASGYAGGRISGSAAPAGTGPTRENMVEQQTRRWSQVHLRRLLHCR